MIPSVLSFEESRDIHISFLADKVVGNEDRGNWSQDCAVGVHPSEKCSAGTIDPPCLQNKEGNKDSDQYSLLVGNPLWRQVGESVCRSDYVRGYTGCNRRHDNTDGSDEHDNFAVDVIKYGYNVERIIPTRSPFLKAMCRIMQLCGLGIESADERAERHRKRHTIKLSSELSLLGRRVSGKVRNVQSHCGPEGDIAHQADQIDNGKVPS